ncbi:hypothetical protein D3C81_1484250 [compost metagenome]
MVDQLRDVIGEGVVVISGPRLIGTAETATIKGNGAIATAAQVFHLVFPHVGIQRPAVAEQHRFTAAPILVVNLGTVLRGEGAHGNSCVRDRE